MKKMKLCIQKAGRLTDESLNTLKQYGLSFPEFGRQGMVSALNAPLDLILVRDDDIPRFVIEGSCEFGIVGLNVWLEYLYSCIDKGSHCSLVEYLGFGKCRLSIASSEKGPQILKDLENKTIATSYPVILQRYLQKNNIKAQIRYVSGGVEMAPLLGIADCICDIVSSGVTLKAHGLIERWSILESESVLVRNDNFSSVSNLKDLIYSKINSPRILTPEVAYA